MTGKCISANQDFLTIALRTIWAHTLIVGIACVANEPHLSQIGLVVVLWHEWVPGGGFENASE